jgi:hypothetical protein
MQEVLGIGPDRISPVQVYRASCQTGSGQERQKTFVPCRSAKTVVQSDPKPRRAFVGSCWLKPDPYI